MGGIFEWETIGRQVEFGKVPFTAVSVSSMYFFCTFFCTFFVVVGTFVVFVEVRSYIRS